MLKCFLHALMCSSLSSCRSVREPRRAAGSRCLRAGSEVERRMNPRPAAPPLLYTRLRLGRVASWQPWDCLGFVSPILWLYSYRRGRASFFFLLYIFVYSCCVVSLGTTDVVKRVQWQNEGIKSFSRALFLLFFRCVFLYFCSCMF